MLWSLLCLQDGQRRWKEFLIPVSESANVTGPNVSRTHLGPIFARSKHKLSGAAVRAGSGSFIILVPYEPFEKCIFLN